MTAIEFVQLLWVTELTGSLVTALGWPTEPAASGVLISFDFKKLLAQLRPFPALGWLRHVCESHWVGRDGVGQLLFV